MMLDPFSMKKAFVNTVPEETTVFHSRFPITSVFRTEGRSPLVIPVMTPTSPNR